MNKLLNIFILLGLCLVMNNCKKGDDDPFLSFRSRNNRLIGKWTQTRYFYYDGKKAGRNNSGDPETILIELKSSGKWYAFANNWEKETLMGNWSWADKTDFIESKEAVILGFQNYVLLTPTFHIIEELRYKKIRTKFLFDGDPKRYYIYEWVRKE